MSRQKAWGDYNKALLVAGVSIEAAAQAVI